MVVIITIKVNSQYEIIVCIMVTGENVIFGGVVTKELSIIRMQLPCHDSKQ